MSGIIGHTLYALLGWQTARERRLPGTDLIGRHFASYLAGAYLGCDIQTMPEGICADTGREVGYGTVPLAKSPLTGGAVRPWRLTHAGQTHTPREIFELFYGRAHLVFGWSRADREHTVPWDHLPDYFADVVTDTLALYGPGERPLAYVLGWLAHVVSDCLIKSVQPGIDLHLLDGKYTPRNRPIQDLVGLHEVGGKELGLDWAALLADLAATPVEPVQLHYMRVAEARGELAAQFANGWQPERRDLLLAVLAENRRWCRVHARDVLRDLALEPAAGGRRECSAAIRQATGLNYTQMIDLAEAAGYRQALRQMGEAIAAMLAATVQRCPALASRPVGELPDWPELTRRWRR